MNRLWAIVAVLVVATACADDQVILARGPIGPASYEVEVTASSDSAEIREHRSATLQITPRARHADFTLRTRSGESLTAELRRLADGSVDLERVRGEPVERSGDAELASLVGQLAPPLPLDSVRIGERWASIQRIRTNTLEATLRTELGIAHFRRIASTDAAQLEGTVSGELSTTSAAGVLSGRLRGRTSIAWAVRSGRVVAADTRLVWTLSTGDTVTLETRVRPL